MTLATYSDLKSAIADWMDRSDLSGSVPDLITLAEARLNREIEAVETDASLSGTSGGRTVSIASLSLIEAMAVYLSSSDDEQEIKIVAAGSFPYLTESGFPAFVAVNDDNLVFDRPLDAAYSIRLRYRARFALSDASPTNDLLTNHPDVYLAACIMWGGLYIEDANKVAGYKALLDQFIGEARNHISQRKRAVLRPDPDLARMIG